MASNLRASLLLVAMPFVTISFLLLVARPGVPLVASLLLLAMASNLRATARTITMMRQQGLFGCTNDLQRKLCRLIQAPTM